MSVLKLHAVLFDMDGLMLDTERIAQQAGMDACADHGYVMDRSLAMQLVGRNSRDTDQILAAHFGSGFDPLAVRERFKARYEAALFDGGLQTKPGLFELLDWLQRLNMPRAVATSTRHDMALRKLAHAGVQRYFEHVIGGDQVSRGKPEPDIFLAAAERLGVEPAHCVVLEDSEPGVQAALAAGMTPLMVPDLKAPSSALLAHGITVCNSLHAVMRHLSARCQLPL
ncbi:HAD family hydrolase [Leeia aquatica]|uniref:HAD family phosphatase n=1 Tax=Leeia aquatica TaxID=2725557 RepID=A0A847SHY2_9NEIS|nr:HAD family phosphatase [Leeia aquatica]NLR76938.1 HAD family phosphatase [Leeia aquatica]